MNKNNAGNELCIHRIVILAGLNVILSRLLPLYFAKVNSWRPFLRWVI